MRKCKLLLALLLVSLAVAAQPPQQFSFQAVLRGNSGNLVVNEQIDVRIRLLYGEKTPQEVYVETHSVKTNSQGVFALSVGAGNVEKGNLKQALSRIDLDTLYLQPEVKRNGAADFVALPAQRMFASPYATYAPTANKADIIPYSESVFATQSYAGSVNIRNEIGRGSDTVFCVKNRAGQPVFTVFDDGVAVGITKDGSFTIYDVNSGAQLFTIDQEKIHMSINDSAFVEQKTGRPQKASFAVGGMAGRAGQSNYLSVEPDATNFNFVENYNTVGRPQKASFAVGGIAGRGRDKQHNIYLSAGDEGFRFAFKEYPTNQLDTVVGFVVNSGSIPVLEIGSSHTTVYVPEDAPSSGRPQKASFAVGGMAGRADASEGYFNISPTWASVNSVNQGKDQITNQLVSGFDVGGISSEVQDYTSYISVASDGTTANQLASDGDATYVREVKANYDPNVVKDANGDWYYGITKVGNYRWLKTNLRGGNTEQDSLNGTFYGNGIGTCPDGWHVANLKDWLSLIDHARNTYSVTKEQITPDFLMEKYQLNFPLTGDNGWGGSSSSYNGFAVFCSDYSWITTISSNGIDTTGDNNPNGQEFTSRCVEGGTTPKVEALQPEPDKVMAQSAVLTAGIVDNGNMPLIDYGFHVIGRDGLDSTYSCKGGPFRYELSGLTKNTYYQVKAYAENNLGRDEEGTGKEFQTKTYPYIAFTNTDRDSISNKMIGWQYSAQCTTYTNSLAIVRYGLCYVTGETPQDQIGTQPSQLNPTILNTCIDVDVSQAVQDIVFFVPGTPGRTTYVRPFAILENNDVMYGGYTKSFRTDPLPEISIKSIEWWGIEPTLSIIYDANIYIDGQMTKVVVHNADPQNDTVINVFEWYDVDNKLEAILPVLIPADHNFTEPYTLNFYLEVGEGDPKQEWKSIAKSAPERFVFSGVKVETLPLSGHGSDNQSSSAMASTFTHIVGDLATFFIGQKFGEGGQDKYIRVKYGPVGTNEEFVLTNHDHVYCDDYCHFDYNARIAGLKPATEYWVQPEVIVRKSTLGSDGYYVHNDSVILTGARQTFTTEPMGEVRTATNTYKTVVLDNVEWMAENLRETDGLKKAEGITDPLFEKDTAYFEAKDKNGGIEIIYNMRAVQEKDLCSMLGEGWMLPGINEMQEQFSYALNEVANSYHPQNNFPAPAVVLRDTTMWDSQSDVTVGKIELPEGLPNNPLLFGLKQVEITAQVQGQTGTQDVTSKGAWLWAGSNGGYMPFIIVQEVIEEKKGNIGSIRCVRYLDKH